MGSQTVGCEPSPSVLTNTKDVHSSVSTKSVRSFSDSRDVKALQAPFANKMFASVYAAYYNTFANYIPIQLRMLWEQ